MPYNHDEATMHSLQKLLKYFHGDTITILAGPKKERFLIHQEALKLSGSASLRILASEGWTEHNHRIIDWSHTDAATVSRICTFLYTSDYETPPPIPRVKTPPPGVEKKDDGDEEGLDLRTNAGSEHETQSQLIPQEAIVEEATVEEAAAEQAIPIEAPTEMVDLSRGSNTASDQNLHQTVLQSLDARPLTPISGIVEKEVTNETSVAFDLTQYPYAQYHYADVLLAHARLYAFAQYHLFPMLATSALKRVVETLNHIRCEEEHAASEVATLAEFVYTNVAAEGLDQDLLRKAISHFVTANLTTLARGDVANALALGGDLTSDVIRKVARRLRADAELVEGLKQGYANLKHIIERIPVADEAPKDEDPWGFGTASSNRRRVRR